MKKSIVFIVNPFSGTSQKSEVKNLIDQEIDHSLYNYRIAYTEYAGHAVYLASEAAKQKNYMVVAVGGDGSVNEVAQGLLHTDTILGVLPGGSGNGFAMHLGLGRDIKKAIKVINQGKPRIIDTCKVNNRFFINVAGVGFDARIAYKTKLNSKRGFLPYFVTSLKQAKNYRPVTLEINIDGKIIKGKYALAAVANATMFGYYFTIAPTAVLNDGLLDLVLIKDASILKYAASSYRFLNRTLDKSSVTQILQGKDISISIKEDDFFHVDGEGMISDKNLKFSIVPNSLQVQFPV